MTSMINTPAFGIGSENFDESLPIDDGVASLFGGQTQGTNSPYAFDGAQSQFPDMNGFNSYGGSSNGTGGAPPGLFAAISAAISQYFQSLSGSDSDGSQSPCGSGAGPCQAAQAMNGAQPNEQQFNNVTASSVGDPHDAVSGTLANGASCNNHWDDMNSERNLLSSNSFQGGFRVSTQTGASNANGATMNQSVSIRSDYGRNQISFNASGQADVRENGIDQGITNGQTLNLGGGTSVTDQGNALIVNEKNEFGGSLSTTLTDNGNGGVDVNAVGQNVALGGSLIKNAT